MKSKKILNFSLFLIIYFLFDNKIVQNISFATLFLIPFFGKLESWTMVDYVKKLSVMIGTAIYFNVNLFPEEYRNSILRLLIWVNVIEVAIYILYKKHILVGILGLIISYYTPKILFDGKNYHSTNSTLWWISNYAMIFYTYNKVGGKNRNMLNLFIILPLLFECLNPKKQFFSIRVKTIFIANLLDTFLDKDFWDSLYYEKIDKLYEKNYVNNILIFLSSLFPIKKILT